MDRRIQIILTLIEEDLHRKSPLNRMAHSVNLSPSHFRYLFKSETGLSVTHYIRLLRMRKAKKLLEFTFLNVKEVMNRVGAYDASHFVRDFKRTYGVTPAQYRARYLTLIAAKKEDREVISSDRPINRQFGQ